MTDHRYKALWSTVKDYIDLVFSEPDSIARSQPYDYGFLHVAVYSLVRDNFSSQYYKDLIKHMKKCISKMKMEIETAQCSPTSVFVAKRSLGKSSAKVGARNVFKTFHRILPQFLENIKQVVIWCFHLDTKYVKAMNTDLRTEFIKLFCSEVVEQHIDKLLRVARSSHTDISPEMKKSVFNHLHQLNPEYLKKDPYLFATVMTDQTCLQEFLEKYWTAPPWDLYFAIQINEPEL